MPEPRAFQQSFGAALAGAANAWADDRAVARALAIHRNTSIRAATEALADNYPVTAQVVGEDAFAAAAFTFVELHPPTDPRLCLFGDGYDRFLSRYAPFRALPYLPDVARLERLVTLALFAADEPAFTGAAFDMAAPLPLHPATFLVRFDTPAATLWQAHQPDAEPAMLEALEWSGDDVLVTRTGDVQVTRIEPAAAAFVGACRDGLSLADAAGAALQAGGDVAAIFAQLIGLGAFSNQIDRGTPA